MADEKTPEQKAAEAEAILIAQNRQLEASATRRIAESREERDRDRLEGRARGEEILGEGTLGRLDETLDPQSQALLDARQAQVDQGVSGDLEAQRIAEQQRVSGDFDRLLEERRAGIEPGQLAAREQGEAGLNRAFRDSLSQANASSNLSGTRTNQRLVNDALQANQLGRAQLERDLILRRDGQLTQLEDLTTAASQARNESLAGTEQARAQRLQVEEDRRQRLEDMQALNKQDQLGRQVFNLDAQSRELFGRIAAEEGRVSEGVAERSGIRSQALSEIQLAEQSRAQQESEELQRLESSKPAPQAGKSVVCIAHYLRGTVTKEVLHADLDYAYDHIDDDTCRGYYSWGIALARGIVNRSLFDLPYFFSKPFVYGWCQHIAYERGVAKNDNIVGHVMKLVGIPMCKALGAVLRWCGQEEVGPEEAKWYFEEVGYLPPENLTRPLAGRVQLVRVTNEY